jgi:hypothetical protein
MEAEARLKRQNQALYQLNWTKQDQLFKDSISPEGETLTTVPLNVLMKNPQTAVPEPFSTMVDNFKFTISKEELEKIHKSSRLALDIWNDYVNVPQRAYVVVESLEEVLVSYVTYTFSQLSDYLSGYDPKKISYTYYDRATDKTLATSAMLLRFWFGQVSFDKIERYSRIDKLKSKRYIKEVAAFLKSFDIYKDAIEIDEANKSEAVSPSKRSLKEAREMFQNKDIKSIDDLEAKDYIDYGQLIDSRDENAKEKMGEEIDPYFFEFSLDTEISRVQGSKTDDAIILKGGYGCCKQDIHVDVKELDENGMEDFEIAIEKGCRLGATGTDFVPPTIVPDDEKIVKTVRKENPILRDENGFVAELTIL